jgi:glycosyltransferase involved in cell wall biosynthesis
MYKLAIVLPAYNSTFLSSALDSIAAQTYKDFTVYIGDDCSPHDLKSIVDRYSNRINLIYRRFDEKPWREGFSCSVVTMR